MGVVCMKDVTVTIRWKQEPLRWLKVGAHIHNSKDATNQQQQITSKYTGDVCKDTVMGCDDTSFSAPGNTYSKTWTLPLFTFTMNCTNTSAHRCSLSHALQASNSQERTHRTKDILRRCYFKRVQACNKVGG